MGPQASGVGNHKLIGRYIQLAIIFNFLTSIPGILIWTFFAEDAVLWFGFDEDTAAAAKSYVYPLLALTLFDGTAGVLEEFLEFSGRERYTTFLAVLVNGLKTAGVVATAASGVKELWLVGVVEASIGIFVSISSLFYILHKGWLDQVWEGLALTNGLRVS